MQSNSRKKGIFLVLFATMLWGVSGTVAQYLFEQQGFTTEWVVAVRLLSSGLLLLLYGKLTGVKDITSIWKERKTRIQIVIFGIFGMLGVQYTYFSAINHGNAATATILQYLAPIFITCYLVVVNKKLPSKTQLVSILFALVGTYIIITGGNVNSLALSKEAIFWGICAGVCAAVYTLQPVALLQQFSAISVVGWGMIIGGILFNLIYPPLHCTGQWNVSSILALLFIILFGTIIAFCCYLNSLRYISPTETSILNCMEPLSATFLSVVWLNVSFGFPQMIGMICIIATVMVLSLKK